MSGAERALSSALLDDASARTLSAGGLEAVFLPAHGMLGASLRHRGVEMLRRVEDLDAAAAKGSTAGIPLLHPWANRLASPRFRVAGREVELDPKSPLLHLDENGLPIHGVPWPTLAWEVSEAAGDRLAAHLEWARSDLLAIFPFRHRIEITVSLLPDSLTLETTLIAGKDDTVPVSFGFHPYFGLPEIPRARWRLELPAMRRLALDRRGIPTGVEEPFARLDAALGELAFDDGFALGGERATFSIAGGGWKVAVELLRGYRYAQVFAPRDKDFIALEPMTAPTSALSSGRGIELVKPGGRFEAAYRIHVLREASRDSA